jgi:hypothetical protein
MKKIILSAFCAMVAHMSFAQSNYFLISKDYEKVLIESKNISAMYIRSFDNKSDAIKEHIRVFGYNFKESLPTVTKKCNTPIFANFLSKTDSSVCITTFVTINEEGGYDSVFLEGINEDYYLFTCDGTDYINSKIIE